VVKQEPPVDFYVQTSSVTEHRQAGRQVVEVLGFDSHDEMIEHIRRAQRTALEGLHPAQQGIGPGDCWVQFHDVANRHIVFGYVLPLPVVRRLEVESGATKREAADAVQETAARLANGFMYGKAYDRFNPKGELGETHKLNVWPIDHRTFSAAKNVDWQIDLLDLPYKINLQAAFTAFRRSN
jgi:hypothetical protein